MFLIFTLLLHKYEQNMKNSLTERRRKSELLRKEEWTALKKYVAGFHTVIDAAVAIGVNRQTLDRVLLIGKGSPESINAIREKLNSVETIRA
jgi:hypothetical protein